MGIQVAVVLYGANTPCSHTTESSESPVHSAVMGADKRVNSALTSHTRPINDLSKEMGTDGFSLQ